MQGMMMKGKEMPMMDEGDPVAAVQAALEKLAQAKPEAAERLQEIAAEVAQLASDSEKPMPGVSTPEQGGKAVKPAL